jgi:hypothetical protein
MVCRAWWQKTRKGRWTENLGAGWMGARVDNKRMDLWDQ